MTPPMDALVARARRMFYENSGHLAVTVYNTPELADVFEIGCAWGMAAMCEVLAADPPGVA